MTSTTRWQQVGTLGQGGQGSVQLVIDSNTESDCRYAFKQLQKGAPAKSLLRFKQEIEAIQRLDHPNVIKVVDFDISATRPFYVMEYFDGSHSLKTMMRSGQNPYQGRAVESLSMFRQLLSAIAAMSLKGILHRDLSPGNILVLPDTSVKIIDFGVCQVDGAERITLVDEGVGTKDYMAPECEPGNVNSIQLHADLYSAAKILWSAITNKAVFARESPAFTTHSMSKEFPKQPETWHLQDIFEVTIRKDIANRKNAQELLNQLWVVEYKILGRMLPEELAGVRCAHCFGNLIESPIANNLVPRGTALRASMCSSCGACFVHDEELIRQKRNERKTLN